MEKLFLFSPSELQMILCGDQTPQWTHEDIVNYTEPKLGYTKDRYASHLLSFDEYILQNHFFKTLYRNIIINKNYIRDDYLIVNVMLISEKLDFL